MRMALPARAADTAREWLSRALQADPRRAAGAALALTGAFLLLAAVADVLANAWCFAGRRLFQTDVWLGCTPYWPLAHAQPRLPSGPDTAAAAAVAAILTYAGRATSLRTALPAAIAIVAISTLVQGGLTGFTHGASDTRFRHYYDDSLAIDEPVRFVRAFNDAQAELGVHSRVHPAGAVLFFYAARAVVPAFTPLFVVLTLAVTATSTALIYRLLRVLGEGPPGAAAGALLMAATAQVQIYFGFSLDAVIATAMLGAIVAVTLAGTALAALAGAAAVVAASSMTFAAVWVLPVAASAEYVVRRSTARTVLAGAGAAVFWAIAYATTGLDYLQNLRTASGLENPYGFWLTAEPLVFLLSRAQAVLEVAAYAGPVLVLAAIAGWRRLFRERAAAWLPVAAGALAFAALLAAGTYFRGETARSCLYLVPLIVLAAGAHTGRCAHPARARARLIVLTGLHGLALQLLFDHYW